MVSIRQLEKLLKPYWIGFGASSDYTNYNEYRHNNTTARIDSNDWFFSNAPKHNYKKALIKATEQLRLKT